MQKIQFNIQGVQQIKEGIVDLKESCLYFENKKQPLDSIRFDVPVSGTVYGTLLNYKNTYKALESFMHKDPYKLPPEAPILYIKPINTLIAERIPIPLPENVEALQMGPALGVVIGKTASKVKKQDAKSYIRGFVIANDVQIPHQNYYRPAIKEIAGDGFCPLGPWIMPLDSVDHPESLEIKCYVNGKLQLKNNTKNLLRPIPKLIADVTEFMTLYEGDVLLTGIPENPPLAKESDVVTVEIEQIGKIENPIVKESPGQEVAT